MHSLHAKGGITLLQNWHLGEGFGFRLVIFFWKCRFEHDRVCLSGTIFHRDLFLGSEMEERGLNDPRLTSEHFGPPGKTEKRNWSFNTNVWCFSYSAPCQASTFITISKLTKNRVPVPKKQDLFWFDHPPISCYLLDKQKNKCIQIPWEGNAIKARGEKKDTVNKQQLTCFILDFSDSYTQHAIKTFLNNHHHISIVTLLIFDSSH